MRQAPKSVLAAALAIAALTVPAFANIPSTPLKMARVEQLGKIRVGESIEGFPKICGEQKRLEAAGVKIHRAFYLIHSGLPPRCMNLECGPFARFVLSRGGILVGGTEEGYSREFGSEIGNSMLLVTNTHGKIEAIYRDASPADMQAIVEEIDHH